MRGLGIVALLSLLMVSTASAQVRSVVELNAGQILPTTSSDTTITANDDAVVVGMENITAVSITVSGTFTGTIQFETDSGQGFTVVTVVNKATNGTATTTTGTGTFIVGNQGYRAVQARSTAWTSGTATITFTRGASAGGMSAAGSDAISGSIETIGTKDLVTVAVFDSNGNQITTFVPTQYAENAAFATGSQTMLSGWRDCGATTSRATNQTTGDVAVPCINDNGAAAVELHSGGSKVEFAVDAEKGAAAPTTGPLLFCEADDSSTAAITEGNAGSVRCNPTTREVLTQAAPMAKSTGGASIYSMTSAGSTEDEFVMCSAACTVYSILVTNTNAAVRYFRCNDDTAANTAPGSETLKTVAGGGTMVIDAAVPGQTTGAGFSVPLPVGAAFGTAATCWLVTGAAITDVAEVAANELKVVWTQKQ
jgi:hypothetical protein